MQLGTAANARSVPAKDAMAQTSINHINLQGNVMLAPLTGGTGSPGSSGLGLVGAITAAAGPCESSRIRGKLAAPDILTLYPEKTIIVSL